eukprot:2200714-Rhodomonas_salina.2
MHSPHFPCSISISSWSNCIPSSSSWLALHEEILFRAFLSCSEEPASQHVHACMEGRTAAAKAYLQPLQVQDLENRDGGKCADTPRDHVTVVTESLPVALAHVPRVPGYPGSRAR